MRKDWPFAEGCPPPKADAAFWRSRRVRADEDYDRRLTLQFRGSVVTSDAGLLAYRELDDAPGLSDLAGERIADARTGKNGRHALVGMLRQAVFVRLAGYEDVNDAERLRHDPAMRWIVGGRAAGQPNNGKGAAALERVRVIISVKVKDGALGREY
jgi:hypothetical protein